MKRFLLCGSTALAMGFAGVAHAGPITFSASFGTAGDFSDSSWVPYSPEGSGDIEFPSGSLYEQADYGVIDGAVIAPSDPSANSATSAVFGSNDYAVSLSEDFAADADSSLSITFYLSNINQNTDGTYGTYYMDVLLNGTPIYCQGNATSNANSGGVSCVNNVDGHDFQEVTLNIQDGALLTGDYSLEFIAENDPSYWYVSDVQVSYSGLPSYLVPEPATAGLVLVGLAGLTVLRRRALARRPQ